MGRSSLLTTDPIPGSGSMSLGFFDNRFHMGLLTTTGPGHIWLERQMVGVRLGNGFLDTCSCPVNTNLDLAGLHFTLRPSLLAIGLVVRPRLTPSLLASCPLGFLFFVWLLPSIYLTGCHFRLGCPLVVFLGSRSLVTQSVKCRCLTRDGLSG